MSLPIPTSGIRGVNLLYDSNTDCTYVIGLTSTIGILSVTGVSGSTGTITNISSSSFGGSLNIFGVTGASSVYVLPTNLKALDMKVLAGGGSTPYVHSSGTTLNAILGGAASSGYAEVYWSSPQTQIGHHLSLTIGQGGQSGLPGSSSNISVTTGATSGSTSILIVNGGQGSSSITFVGVNGSGFALGAISTGIPTVIGPGYTYTPSWSYLLAGNQGGHGLSTSDQNCYSGYGAASFLGNQFPSTTRNTANDSTMTWGCGAAGSAVQNGTSPSGSGGNGIIIVTEYY